MVKTNELTGAALDWAVAKCEGWGISVDEFLRSQMANSKFAYATVWAKGGPIIEREGMHVDCLRQGTSPVWEAWPYVGGTKFIQQGATPLIAAMRCYVASKLGDEVEMPEGL